MDDEEERERERRKYQIADNIINKINIIIIVTVDALFCLH